MKKITKICAAIMLGAFAALSCENFEGEQLAKSVYTSVAEITLPGAGSESRTVELNADGDWIIIGGEDWFTFSPASGNGNATITLTPTKENLDSYGELCGPKSGVINIFGNEASVVLTVKQEGESGLDSKRFYSKVTSLDQFDASKGIILVTQYGGKYYAPVTCPATAARYEYMYGEEIAVGEDGITLPNPSRAFLLVPVGDKFAIRQPNGTFLSHSKGYDSFYAYDDISQAELYSLSFAADGAAILKNDEGDFTQKIYNGTVEYTGKVDASTVDEGCVPFLYIDSAAPSDEVISAPGETMVSAGETTVKIPVSSNMTWKVRNHDSWIKSFTKQGEGDGFIEVTFDENTSETDQKTATFQIIGETTNFNVTLIQDKFYPITDITVADFLAAPVSAQKYRLSGKIKGMVNAAKGNFYLQDGTGYVYIYGMTVSAESTSKDLAAAGFREGDIVTVVGQRAQYASSKVEDQKEEMGSCYCESVIGSTDATVAEVLAAPVAGTYLTDKYYHVTGVVKEIVNATYGNLYLKSEDGDDYIYVYGVTAAPVAKNDKSFAGFGVKQGDILTIVGQRGQYPGSKVEDQKEEIVNALYVSHETGTHVQKDFTGRYVIVYKASATEYCIFNGKDAVNGYVAATLEGDKLKADSETPLADCIAEVAPMEGGYSVKVGAKYIGGKNNSNALSFSDTPLLNTITEEADGSVLLTSETSVLRFNSNSDQMRFRYYKASSYAAQKPIVFFDASKVEFTAPASELPAGTVLAHFINNQESTYIETKSPDRSTEGANDYSHGTGKGICNGEEPGVTGQWVRPEANAALEAPDFISSAEGHYAIKRIWTDDAFVITAPVSKISAGRTLNFKTCIRGTKTCQASWTVEFCFDGTTWVAPVPCQLKYKDGSDVDCMTKAGSTTVWYYYDVAIKVPVTLEKTSVKVRLRCTDGTLQVQNKTVSAQVDGTLRIYGIEGVCDGPILTVVD